MTAIKPAGLDAFLRKPDPAIAAILIYGEEGDAVRELAQRAVKKVAGSLDDPFSVMTVKGSSSEPAIFFTARWASSRTASPSSP